MIDILVPVLGRPANAMPLVESIHANTTLPHTVLFACTPGDTAQIEACKQTGSIVVLVDGDDYQYPTKINAAANFQPGSTPSEWVFLGADDLRFHPGWDEAAVAAHNATGALVVGTDDRGNPTVMAGKHATHSLVHRSYLEQGTIDEPGLVLHEGYHHNFCDSELVETAKARGVWTFSSASIVVHNHPFWRKAEDDDVYEKGRAFYHVDARLFRRRSRLWA